MRDEFSASIKETLSKRVALRCSNPACLAPTSGPHSSPSKSVNLGVASHITAAAAGGPRYDGTLSTEQRASSENAIWLCQRCAKLVDNDCTRFTVQVLQKWKFQAEEGALRQLDGIIDQRLVPQPSQAIHTPIPNIAHLSYDDARAGLVAAGWQPWRRHWSATLSPDLQCGNGLHYWGKGYWEIVYASGTGLGHCEFAFKDVYENELRVVTAGEVVENVSTASVWRWYLKR
jgi:hypothetical protein